MSCVKIFPNQNVQERFSITKSRVITNTCLYAYTKFQVYNVIPKNFSQGVI